MVFGFNWSQVSVRVRVQQYGLGSNSVGAFYLYLDLVTNVDLRMFN